MTNSIRKRDTVSLMIDQFISGLRSAAAALIIEFPARWIGFDRLIQRLEKGGRALDRRAASTGKRPANAAVLAHIIGIERWGQRRMRVALGEPLLQEEYNDYRPLETDVPTLRAVFQATRQETVSLCKSLRMAGVDPGTRIYHNQFGEISLLGWLYYLIFHAGIESLRIY